MNNKTLAKAIFEDLKKKSPDLSDDFISVIQKRLDQEIALIRSATSENHIFSNSKAMRDHEFSILGSNWKDDDRRNDDDDDHGPTIKHFQD